MNHGNHDNKSTVDKLNQWIARLFGKKSAIDQVQPPQKPQDSISGNAKFTVIVTGIMTVLWLLSGLYYVRDNEFGVVLKSGEVNEVVHGLKFGVTLPYPFGEIVIFANDINNVVKPSENQDNKFLTADNKEFVVGIDFSYSIESPEKFFINYYQGNDDFKQHVSGAVMSLIQEYLLRHNSSELLSVNTIIIANEIRELSSNDLEQSGVRLDKLTITSLQENVEESTMVKSPSVAVVKSESDTINQLLSEAQLYKQNIANQTESEINEFNKLLTEYKTNPAMVAELLYYKMLSKIPAINLENQYKLLNSNLSELEKQQISSTTTNNDRNSLRKSRTVNREVIRERVFKER